MIGIGFLVLALSAYVGANAHFAKDDALKFWSFMIGVIGAAIGGAIIHYGFAEIPRV